MFMKEVSCSGIFFTCDNRIDNLYPCRYYRYVVQHEREEQYNAVQEPVLPYEETSINMTVKSILGFVVLMCIMLLCLYFLYAYLGKYSAYTQI